MAAVESGEAQEHIPASIRMQKDHSVLLSSIYANEHGTNPQLTKVYTPTAGGVMEENPCAAAFTKPATFAWSFASPSGPHTPLETSTPHGLAVMMASGRRVIERAAVCM